MRRGRDLLVVVREVTVRVVVVVVVVGAREEVRDVAGDLTSRGKAEAEAGIKMEARLERRRRVMDPSLQ